MHTKVNSAKDNQRPAATDAKDDDEGDYSGGGGGCSIKPSNRLCLPLKGKNGVSSKLPYNSH